MKTDSQTKSSSTGEPTELESPQELTDYTSDLPGYVGEAKVKAPEPTPTEPGTEQSTEANLNGILSNIKAGALSMPRVRVIEDGKETVGELDVGLISMVTNLAQLGQMTRVRKALEREQFQGKLLSVDLEATDAYQATDLTKSDPYVPWATATFRNDGPDAAYLAINKHRPCHLLNKGESLPADFTKADTRIYYLEYYCDSGETATIRALGKY